MNTILAAAPTRPSTPRARKYNGDRLTHFSRLGGGGVTLVWLATAGMKARTGIPVTAARANRLHLAGERVVTRID